MTAEKDPRIEAVAKVMFTGPISGYDIEQWGDKDYPSLEVDRRACLRAAEQVLRAIDEMAHVEQQKRGRP